MSNFEPKSKSGVPSRGTILCVFQDSALVQSIEPAISRRGFALLRARNSMHGLWMATTTQPDVIMTDIPQAPNQSDQLLDSLKKNRRAREIPVIALVDSLKQSIIRPTCLRLADRVLLKNSTVDSILDTAVEMIESRVRPDSTKSLRTPDRTIRVDAVFSEIGTTVTSAEPAPDSKFGTVYRQRESVNHALAAEQQRQDGHRKFDEAHDGERRAFSKIAEERLMRHLRNLNAK